MSECLFVFLFVCVMWCVSSTRRLCVWLCVWLYLAFVIVVTTQAADGGAITVRLSITGRDGQIFMPGWRGPAAKDSPAVEAVLCVEVIDDGPGFGSCHPDTLFQPFYLTTGG